MNDYKMRQAHKEDINRVIELINNRTKWLAERGSDQWSTNRSRLQERMANHIAAGRTWVLDRNQETVGTVSISTEADKDFWTNEEQKTPSLYIFRLATDPNLTGMGLGKHILQWSINYAAEHDLAEVRCDAWKTSPGLHNYYLNNGWKYLRTEEVPGRYSGALFSHPAKRYKTIQSN